MTIIAAAIQQGSLIYTLPPPKRHHHILHLMADLVGLPTPISGEQGFLTSKGHFVVREIAAQIAIAEGQIEKLRWPPDLYSEDLW